MPRAEFVLFIIVRYEIHRAIIRRPTKEEKIFAAGMQIAGWDVIFIERDASDV